jgi:hypothetical protein
MSRISLSDSTIDIVVKMSDGNPGAMAAMFGLLQEVEKDIENFSVILALDLLKVYGSRLYQLWNDCCGRDINKMIKVLDLCSKGKISKEDFLNHIDQPHGIPFEIETWNICSNCEYWLEKYQKCEHPDQRSDESGDYDAPPTKHCELWESVTD